MKSANSSVESDWPDAAQRLFNFRAASRSPQR